MEFLKGTSLELHEIDEKAAVIYNPYAIRPIETNSKREEFFKRFANEPVCGLIRELSGEKNIPAKIIGKIKDMAQAAIRKIFK